MNLGNMFSLATSSTELCTTLGPVWTIFGYIIFAIKIVVPLLLIVTGMIALAKAVMQQDEKEIKKAQGVLISKLITAVLVYLVITITGVVVGLVSKEDWEGCAKCAFSPFTAGCEIVDSNEVVNHPKTENDNQ